MKKKHYIYRLVCTGVDYANLESAVKDAYAHIKRNAYQDERISSPYVLKVDGGYQVSVFRNDGNVLRRKIDVFEPFATAQNAPKVKTHNVRANKAGESNLPTRLWYLDDEDETDDECDFNCDECNDENCEDRLLDEDEGE